MTKKQQFTGRSQGKARRTLYNEGVAARHAGKEIFVNPHVADEAARLWAAGWRANTFLPLPRPGKKSI